MLIARFRYDENIFSTVGESPVCIAMQKFSSSGELFLAISCIQF